MTIWFDMDGTIANLYGVDGWLDSIIKEHTKPYREAKPLVDMRRLARDLKALQNKGYEVGIISWLAKNATEEYNTRVTKAKIDWLKIHLGSVEFNEIHIVKYGTPKYTLGNGILFDDEEPNRNAWGDGAYDVHNILEVLENL